MSDSDALFGTAEIDAGRPFGDYDLLEEIEAGGMGVVFRARHRPLGRICALKVFKDSFGDDALREKVFIGEARALGQLDHHNIVRVHHASVHNGHPFIEMELVETSAWVEALPFTTNEALRILEQIARALSHAHSHGILHRDIKPTNILLTPDHMVKVADFGLARHTRSQSIPRGEDLVGTPEFVAPELWNGEVPSVASDLYAVGVTAYQILNGRAPYRGPDFASIRSQHMKAELPPWNADVPTPVRELVARLLNKAPENRFGSAEELIEALRRIQHGDVPPPSQPGLPSRQTSELVPPAPWPRRFVSSVFVALVALMSSVGLAELGVLTVLENRTEDWCVVHLSSDPRQEHVTLIAVDQETLREGSRGEPMSRAQELGLALDQLTDAKAHAVAVDFLIPIPSLEDESYAEAIRLNGRVVNALALISPQTGTMRSAKVAESLPLPESWSLPLDHQGLAETTMAIPPAPTLRHESIRVGHIQLSVDPVDAVTRRIPLLLGYDDRVYPSLSLQLFRIATESIDDPLRFTGRSIEIVHRNGRTTRIPTTEKGELRFRPRWPPDIDVIPFEEFVKGDPTIYEDRLKNRVVIIGSLEDQKDSGSLPGRALSPFVWAHVFATETLMEGAWIHAMPLRVWCSVVFVLSLLVAFLGQIRKRRFAFGMVIGASLVALGAPVVTFVWFDILTPMWSSLVALALTASATLVLRHRERKRRHDALSSLITKSLPLDAARLALAEATPRSSRREISVLHLELVGLASAIDRVEPEEVDTLLREVFSTACDSVASQGGYVELFDGSSIRALFGAPSELPDHPTRALRCAGLLRDGAKATLAKWHKGGRPEVRVGLGVETGYMTIGLVQSETAIQYTALGRASLRAEEMASFGDGEVRIGARTASLTREVIQTKTLSDSSILLVG